jgi:hypothetical protein
LAPIISRGDLIFGLDGTVEMSAEGGEYLMRSRWTKIAEWTGEDALDGPRRYQAVPKFGGSFNSYNVRDMSERPPPATDTVPVMDVGRYL